MLMRFLRAPIVAALVALALLPALPGPAGAFFAVTHLAGFGAASGATTVSTTFASVVTSGTNATSYTLSVTGMETSGNRIICIHGRKASPSLTINSVTLDGASATILGSQLDNAGSSTACYIAASTGNTTGDVVVSLSGTWLRITVAVWNVRNLLSTSPTSTPSTDTTATSSAYSVTVDVQAGGAAFGMNGDSNGSGGTRWTWSGLDEASGCDVAPESGVSGTCANADFATAQSGLTVTATASSSPNDGALLVVPMR